MRRLDQAGIGILLLVSDEGVLDRAVTDGDIRRLILAGRGLDETLDALPQAKCITAPLGATRREALELMNRHGISHLPLVDERGQAKKLLMRREIDEQVLLSTPHMGDA